MFKRKPFGKQRDLFTHHRNPLEWQKLPLETRQSTQHLLAKLLLGLLPAQDRKEGRHAIED